MQLIHTITQQQELFCSWVSTPLQNIANHCAKLWSQQPENTDQFTAALEESMKQIPQYALCYLISPQGKILTPTISHTGNDPLDRGKDVSLRPYFLEWNGHQDFFLSRPYTSTKTNHACMTALQTVRVDGEIFAIIAIDFDGNRTTFNPALGQRNYTQIKGDPSIRQQLFAQTRTITTMEEQIETVHQRATALLLHHGAFYIQLRYSRSTTTVRFTDRPYEDSVWALEQLLLSDTGNRQPMTSLSTTAAEQIPAVLQLFHSLRLADENIYLRSGSINIITGMVELNFSCDGTHYLPIPEFLEKSTAFWLTTSDRGTLADTDPFALNHASLENSQKTPLSSVSD